MGNSAPSRPRRAGIATVIIAIVSGVFWAGNLNGKVAAVAEECQQAVTVQASVDRTQDQHWLLIIEDVRESQLRLEDRLDAVLTVLRKQGERQAQQGAMLAALLEG